MSGVNAGELTLSIKRLAKEHGAVLVGVAPVERFDPMPPLYDAAPRGQHPRDFLPESRSVISIAQPILNPVMEAPAVLADRELEMVPEHAKYEYLEGLYDEVGHTLHDSMLEFIAQIIGQHLLANGFDAMIFPTTGCDCLRVCPIPRKPRHLTNRLKGIYEDWDHRHT